jgi:Uma2 family endonuclease
MGAVAIPKLSVQEYLAMDREAELKSEFHDGEVFPLAAVSWEHAQIVVRTARRLDERLEGTPCRVAASPIRVRVSPTKFVYPDIVVVCGQPALTDEVADTLTNPKVIVEVLSPSTMDYDYGGKFALYRRLPSFEEYLLVAQDEPRVEVFRRAGEHTWVLTTYLGLDAVIPVQSLNISIPMAELQAG